MGGGRRGNHHRLNGGIPEKLVHSGRKAGSRHQLRDNPRPFWVGVGNNGKLASRKGGEGTGQIPSPSTNTGQSDSYFIHSVPLNSSERAKPARTEWGTRRPQQR